MSDSFTALPTALSQIKQQCLTTAFSILSEVCKVPEFSNNSALLSQLADIKSRFSELQDRDFQILINNETSIASRGIIGEVQRQIQALALVDQEDLAFKISAEEFTEKVGMGEGIALALLTMRVESIIGRELEEEELPLSPEKLIKAFQSAVQPAELDRDLKTLFFSHLCRVLNHYYSQYLSAANNICIDLNILSDLNESDGHARFKRRRDRIKAAVKRKALMSSISQSVQLDDKGNPIPPKMDELLEQICIPQASSEHQFEEVLMAGDASQQDVLGFVDELQQIKLSQSVSGYQQLHSELSLVNQLQQQTGLGEYNLSRSHANCIGMMSMLFDDLFSNSQIATPIKALLEQLQGPLLKTALLDKNFFADSGNPAQLLLDTLAEQGAGWAPDKDPEKDFTYKKMAEMSKNVTTDFDGSYRVFEDAVLEFKVFYKKHQQRVEKIEARIVTAEKAKARFDRAHEEAAKHIDENFGLYELPSALDDFLHQYWQQVLFFIHNKYDNQNSLEWRKAVFTERLLLQNLDGHEKANAKKSLIALQQMMLQVGNDKTDINIALKSILTVVKKASKRAAPAVEKEIEKEVALVPETDSAMMFDENIDIDTALSSAEAANDDDNDLDVHLNETQITQLQDQLAVGSWLMDHSESDQEKIKIAAYIKHTDTYILVHRNGTKCANYNSHEIYNRIKRNQLTVIESALMFDRALESVIVSIRSA